MIGSLEIAQARVLAARAAERSELTPLDVDARQDDTESGVAGDVTREEELS